jgi:hypothetical protein
MRLRDRASRFDFLKATVTSSMPMPEPAALPLRALCVLANPSDLPRFDDAGLWSEMQESLLPFQSRGALAFERLSEPTENALKKTLAQGNWNVLHLVVHAQERSSANYGTIALQSSDGQARNLTAGYLAGLLAGVPSLRLVIVQGCDCNSASFDTITGALLEQGVPFVAAVPALRGKQLQIFLSKLYAGLFMGLRADEIAKEWQAAMPASAPRLLSRDGNRAVFAVAAPGESVSRQAPPPQSSQQPDSEPAWHEQIRRKRAAGEFDVFMCHNGADKPEVKQIAQQLKESGVLPWLDVWELPPGQPWQPLLEQQIGSIKSAAVCFGSAGIGPWQEREMYALLSEFVERDVPVIPVLLPDAPLVPELPRFLRGMTWVDFRRSDPDPLAQLIWGITGKRPEEE